MTFLRVCSVGENHTTRLPKRRATASAAAALSSEGASCTTRPTSLPGTPRRAAIFCPKVATATSAAWRPRTFLLLRAGSPSSPSLSSKPPDSAAHENAPRASREIITPRAQGPGSCRMTAAPGPSMPPFRAGGANPILHARGPEILNITRPALSRTPRTPPQSRLQDQAASGEACQKRRWALDWSAFWRNVRFKGGRL